VYCPNCKTEHREGFYTCSDCGAALIPELPPKPTPDYFDYEAVLVTENPADLMFLRSVLDSEGIEHYVDGNVSRHHLAQPAGLMVNAKKAHEARPIIEDLMLNHVEATVPNEVDQGQYSYNPSTAIGDWEREQRLLQSGGPDLQKSNKLGWLIIGLATGAIVTAVGFGIIIYSLFPPYEVIIRDNNGDGKTDQWHRYERGIIQSVEKDRNFDGITDEVVTYNNGIPESVTWDLDFNGITDLSGQFRYGLLRIIEFRPNGSKIILKKQIYKHGFLHEDFVDKDKDGKFDELRIFDMLLDPVKTIPLR
jgi:hypothetical protein